MVEVSTASIGSVVAKWGESVAGEASDCAFSWHQPGSLVSVKPASPSQNRQKDSSSSSSKMAQPLWKRCSHTWKCTQWQVSFETLTFSMWWCDTLPCKQCLKHPISLTGGCSCWVSSAWGTVFAALVLLWLAHPFWGHLSISVVLMGKRPQPVKEWITEQRVWVVWSQCSMQGSPHHCILACAVRGMFLHRPRVLRCHGWWWCIFSNVEWATKISDLSWRMKEFTIRHSKMHGINDEQVKIFVCIHCHLFHGHCHSLFCSQMTLVCPVSSCQLIVAALLHQQQSGHGGATEIEEATRTWTGAFPMTHRNKSWQQIMSGTSEQERCLTWGEQQSLPFSQQSLI